MPLAFASSSVFPTALKNGGMCLIEASLHWFIIFSFFEGVEVVSIIQVATPLIDSSSQ